MTKALTYLIITGATLIGLGIFSACHKDEPVEHVILVKLHKQNPRAGIEECTLNGRLVYCISQLYIDGGSAVYDMGGNKILTCNYAWNAVDSGCYQLRDCEQVYCPAGNALNLPPVDKYGIEQR
jgi:hypothetical protein